MTAIVEYVKQPTQSVVVSHVTSNAVYYSYSTMMTMSVVVAVTDFHVVSLDHDQTTVANDSVVSFEADSVPMVVAASAAHYE